MRFIAILVCIGILAACGKAPEDVFFNTISQEHKDMWPTQPKIVCIQTREDTKWSDTFKRAWNHMCNPHQLYA